MTSGMCGISTVRTIDYGKYLHEGIQKHGAWKPQKKYVTITDINSAEKSLDPTLPT